MTAVQNSPQDTVNEPSVLERNDLGRKLESPAYINRKIIRAAFANVWKNQLYPEE